MIKLLIGGSPCTFWSIAQKNNRETEASGLGWELFNNYITAKKKFNPDFFLYENNKSASPEIKASIRKELNVYDGSLFSEDTGARYVEINSALVSAQNRQRFYVHNCGEVTPPDDRGILLKDILDDNNEDATCVAMRGRRYCGQEQHFEARTDNKTNTLTTVQKDNYVAESVRIGTLPNSQGIMKDAQATRIYSVDGKSVNIVANGGGQGAKTGLYAIPAEELDKNVYKVTNGQMEYKGNLYPIKLDDGLYRIRNLSVSECCRLQTLPIDYCRAVSNAQAYKGLGNGWTAEVIIHILNSALKDVPRDEEIVVLSMYDGIGTGRYCLDKMGFTNVKYFAYEIDKYAMQIAKSNYPDIIELGDAYQVLKEDWKLPIEV